VRECEHDRARGEQEEGAGGLDRLIYLPSDQATYLPSNLPPSDTDALTARASRNVYESESDRDGVS